MSGGRGKEEDPGRLEKGSDGLQGRVGGPAHCKYCLCTEEWGAGQTRYPMSVHRHGRDDTAAVCWCSSARNGWREVALTRSQGLCIG